MSEVQNSLRQMRQSAASGSRLVYPALMSAVFIIYYLLQSHALPVITSAYICISLAACCIIAMERFMPYRNCWTAGANDLKNDSLYLLLVQILLPKLLTLSSVWILLKVFAIKTPSVLWPHQWPVAAQVLLMFLTADFFRYWLHRWSHTNPLLWRLHAVHHSPHKLYWLNVGRFHPVEKTLQFLLDALPFIVLAVSEEVLALYFVFYAVNGFLQHCNINLELGFLNYIISGPQLHRWHHSARPVEANSNYGNNIILWDLLFGTYYLPSQNKVGELGLHNRSYPESFSSQMLTPLTNIDQHPRPQNRLFRTLLNFLLHLKMQLVYFRLVRPFLKSAENPMTHQRKLLRRILRKNETCEYALKFKFSQIETIADYRKALPIVGYEELRPWIEKQDELKKTF